MKFSIILTLLTISLVYSNLASQKTTHQVTFSVQIDGTSAGDIVIDLFGEVTPKTVQNFFTICQGSVTKQGKKYAYQGSIFHRIIPNFMIQGGDFTNFDGTGGRSIFGRSFNDQNFKLLHEPFCLSMANAGPNTNGSQFFITTADTTWLNGRHVVFGRVSEGRDVVKRVQSEGTQSGKPKHKVKIAKCTARKL